MKVIGLDGKIYDMDVNPKKHPIRSQGNCKSKLQFECGQILKEKYGFEVILEECYVPPHGFYLDFFIPKRKIVLEIHGSQHDNYVPFFHGSKKDFHKSKNRDMDKKIWAESNGFTFIEVRSKDDLNQILN